MHQKLFQVLHWNEQDKYELEEFKVKPKARITAATLFFIYILAPSQLNQMEQPRQSSTLQI